MKKLSLVQSFKIKLEEFLKIHLGNMEQEKKSLVSFLLDTSYLSQFALMITGENKLQLETENKNLGQLNMNPIFHVHVLKLNS